ncbi:hypothetical protein Tco_1331614 [Tanacetum coccineum]
MYNPQRASPPPNQSSPIPAFNLDDDSFEPLWASASQPSQYTEGPSQPVEFNWKSFIYGLVFEFQQQQKWVEDIKYYNEYHEHLTGRALSTALLLKKKIKERWNLHYQFKF